MRLYAWNIEASAALWSDFAVLEVCLRNTINNQLSAHTGQADWWNSPHLVLRAEQQDTIQAVGGQAGLAQPSQVVASLTFGFWTALLANRYHQRLWVPALHLAFPYYSGRRGALQQDLEHLRRLRNRLAHHEPVFSRDMAADHQRAVNILRWITPAAGDWAEQASRLPSVLAGRAATVAGTRPPTF